jgi:hypothetical protein
MGKFNSINVDSRKNRPSADSKVKLDLHYLQNGSLTDPYSISSVVIFRDTTASSSEFPYLSNGLPEFFIDLSAGSNDYGLLNSSANDLMIFRFSSTLQDPSAYTGTGSSCSSVYRTQTGTTGRFSVILTPGASCFDFSGGSVTIGTSGLQTGSYFDIWIIQNNSNSRHRLYIHQFTLHESNTITLDEFPIIDITSRLKQKKIELGETLNIHFLNDITIANTNITQSIKNIFKDSIISNAGIRIIKVNEDANVASRYQVSGFADTSGLVEITSTDDILFLLNTAIFTNLSNTVESYGSPRGLYQLQARMEISNEVYYSPFFFLRVE